MTCSCGRHPDEEDAKRAQENPEVPYTDFWAGVEDGQWKVHSSSYCRSLPRARLWHRFLWWLGNLCFRLAGPRAQERVAAMLEEHAHRQKQAEERERKRAFRQLLEDAYDNAARGNT